MLKKKRCSSEPEKKLSQSDVFNHDDDIYYKEKMPNKYHVRRKVGHNETEGDIRNKDIKCIIYIDTIMYWLIRLIIVLSSSVTVVHFIIKLIDSG